MYSLSRLKSANEQNIDAAIAAFDSQMRSARSPSNPFTRERLCDGHRPLGISGEGNRRTQKVTPHRFDISIRKVISHSRRYFAGRGTECGGDDDPDQLASETILATCKGQTPYFLETTLSQLWGGSVIQSMHRQGLLWTPRWKARYGLIEPSKKYSLLILQPGHSLTARRESRPRPCRLIRVHTFSVHALTCVCRPVHVYLSFRQGLEIPHEVAAAAGTSPSAA